MKKVENFILRVVHDFDHYNITPYKYPKMKPISELLDNVFAMIMLTIPVVCQMTGLIMSFVVITSYWNFFPKIDGIIVLLLLYALTTLSTGYMYGMRILIQPVIRLIRAC
jgi:hypothetical protein